MKKLVIWVFLFFQITVGFVGVSRAQESKVPSWDELLKRGQCEEARKLCSGWLSSADISRKVEAHKCLANVALCGEDVVILQPSDLGGGFMGSGYKEEAVDNALGHLEEALKLAPQDLSIHKGRLHLLGVSARFPEMTKALEESCRSYKGADGLDAWLAYTAELFETSQFRASLSLLKVLEEYFPNSHDVLGNIGGVLSMLKEDDQAVAYLRRAVELAPTDPIDTWNLARVYDYTGKLELAENWYQKALTLQSDLAKRREQTCLYASFVEHKLHNSKRACELQQANCPTEERTACSESK